MKRPGYFLAQCSGLLLACAGAPAAVSGKGLTPVTNAIGLTVVVAGIAVFVFASLVRWLTSNANASNS